MDKFYACESQSQSPDQKLLEVLNDQGWVVIIHELKLLRKETGPEKTIKIAVNMVVVDFLYTCLINLLIDL